MPVIEDPKTLLDRSRQVCGTSCDDAARLAPGRFSGVGGPSELQPHAPMVPPFVPRNGPQCQDYSVDLRKMEAAWGSNLRPTHYKYARTPLSPCSASPFVHVEVFTVLR